MPSAYRVGCACDQHEEHGHWRGELERDSPVNITPETSRMTSSEKLVSSGSSKRDKQSDVMECGNPLPDW